MEHLRQSKYILTLTRREDTIAQMRNRHISTECPWLRSIESEHDPREPYYIPLAIGASLGVTFDPPTKSKQVLVWGRVPAGLWVIQIVTDNPDDKAMGWQTLPNSECYLGYAQAFVPVYLKPGTPTPQNLNFRAHRIR